MLFLYSYRRLRSQKLCRKIHPHPLQTKGHKNLHFLFVVLLRMLRLSRYINSYFNQRAPDLWSLDTIIRISTVRVWRMASPASSVLKLPYRYLGSSGLKVSTICLGTMTFGQREVRRKLRFPARSGWKRTEVLKKLGAHYSSVIMGSYIGASLTSYE